MRSCRHCAHENADHLAYCSQCGRRLTRTDTVMPAVWRATGNGAAYSHTVMATPFPASATGRPTVASGRFSERSLAPTTPSGSAFVLGAIGAPPAPAAPRSRVRWLGESIGYIYVYLRSKLDAGERRRRLLEERTGAEALLAGALNEVGQIVLREGVQHTELTGLLEAIGRAHARREAAAADAATSEGLQQNEATRLANQQSAAEAEWAAADKASRESEQILRDATADRRTTGARLSRVKDERARIERDTSDDSGPIGSPRLAQLAHDAAGLAAEQRALEEHVERLDAQLADLRAKAATLRDAAATAKSKLDQSVAGRRQAASAMAASIAGRMRDRADAEREISDLTAQIGRVTAEVRPPHASLLSGYQNIDRLSETISDRSAQLEAIEQARSHYDHRKLLAGLGLVTCMLVVISAALWKFLK